MLVAPAFSRADEHEYLMSFLVTKLPQNLTEKRRGQLTFVSQVMLLVRQVYQFVRTNKRVQLFLALFLIVYAYVAYRVLRIAKVYLRQFVE